jgi:hypothetical protein
LEHLQQHLQLEAACLVALHKERLDHSLALNQQHRQQDCLERQHLPLDCLEQQHLQRPLLEVYLEQRQLRLPLEVYLEQVQLRLPLEAYLEQHLLQVDCSELHRLHQQLQVLGHQHLERSQPQQDLGDLVPLPPLHPLQQACLEHPSPLERLVLALLPQLLLLLPRLALELLLLLDSVSNMLSVGLSS